MSYLMHDMTLGRMVGGALGFIEPAYSRPFEQALFNFVRHNVCGLVTF